MSRDFIITMGVIVAGVVAVSLYTSLVGVPGRPHAWTAGDVKSLAMAIEYFHEEYGMYPDFGMEGDEAQADGRSGSSLFTILLGKEVVTDKIQNRKRIAFLNVKVSKSRARGGLVYSSGGSGVIPEGLYDAWGNPLHMKFDIDCDQQIEDPLEQGKVIRNKPVVVYSFGPDRNPGGGDDIISW
ncbi:hypothetical protein [Luteolibacter luteus]|uniref:Uncharacterized protein n=1 Tax=Luteolibacter luteus TaxID=2728835 RepID=A0A858RJR7_9BACT|nr:hypothetical protein [Luteolibacter luteus]QJE97167.1 hypothetical protein HHL09_15670 [Luteolibacter luteus]